MTSEPTRFASTDDAWAVIAELCLAAEEGDPQRLATAALSWAHLRPAERRAVRAALGHGLWFAMCRIADGHGLNIDGVHQVATAIYPSFQDVLKHDITVLEHVLRSSFELSDWPLDEMDKTEFILAAGTALGLLLAPAKLDIKQVRAEVESWLMTEGHHT